jgi:antitoxin FitA
MAGITIRNLDDDVKRCLRIRAAQNGRSMEEEARAILKKALATPETQKPNMYTLMRNIAEPLGGIEIPIPRRGPARRPPKLG